MTTKLVKQKGRPDRIGAAFEQDVSLAFLGDGVYQLTKGQDTKGIGIKNHSKTYRALEGYDVEKLYVERESLAARGLIEIGYGGVRVLDFDRLRTVRPEPA